LRERVAKEVSKSLDLKFHADDVLDTLYSIFASIFPEKIVGKGKQSVAIAAVQSFEAAKELSSNGYARTEFTAELISRFLGGVRVEVNESCPPLSKVTLANETLVQVEVLKRFTYVATIMSSRLKVTEHRGYQIVKNIFENVTSIDPDGALLLPDDCRALHSRFKDLSEKKRVICDFICGMTDRYAVEFFARLNSEQPQSIFKPL
jgi:dGTPase